jgi:uncharacterized protein YndB with AHSA1/START domain
MSEAFSTSLHIEAPPEVVFDYFTRPELLVRWMGEYARLEAVNGGVFSVDISGVLIRGSFVAIDRPRRIEIAWGEAGNAEMPPGATTLEIALEPSGAGTQLTLVHSGLVGAELEKHAMGWPHFLARLGVAAAGGEPGPYPWAQNPPG